MLFLGDHEARALWGRDDAEFVRELCDRQGSQEVVLKRGKHGSLVLIEDRTLEQPAFPVIEVDPIGAGDAFDAGYLAGYLWGLAPEERLRTANAMGAVSVATLGDYEGLPDRGELRGFLEGRPSRWGDKSIRYDCRLDECATDLSPKGAAMQAIEGVYVANVTPFIEAPHYTLDVVAYLEHVSWLAGSGVTSIVPFGTNGDGSSVAMGEKLSVLEVLFLRSFSSRAYRP